MGYWSHNLSIVIISILFCLHGQGAQCAEKKIADGLVLIDIHKNGLGAEYLQVDLTKFDVRVVTALVPIRNSVQASSGLEHEPRGFSLGDYLNLYNATAVLSGGYIATFSPPAPLGLIKSNGILASAPHHSWLVDGVFCSDSGRAAVQPFDGSDLSRFRDCLQAGPLLLTNGKPPTRVPSAGYQRLANSVQEQAFLCILPNDQLALGITGEVDLPSLVDFLREQLSCVDAIRLTGKETAGLRVNSDLYGNDSYLFPSAIAVSPRNQ